MTSNIKTHGFLNRTLADLPVPPLELDPQPSAATEMIDKLAEEKAKQKANSNTSDLKDRVTTPRKTSSILDPQTPNKTDDSEGTPGSSPSNNSDGTPQDINTSFSLPSFDKSPYSNPGTPDHSTSATPAATPSSKTPTAVTRLLDVIDKNDPTCDLSPRSRKTLDAGIKKLDEVKTPARKNEYTTRIRERLGKTLIATGASQVSPSCQQRLVFSCTLVQELRDSWTTFLAHRVDVTILDAKHFQDLEDDGGFHICPAGHQRDASVHFRRTNIETGVWCGKVFDSDRPTKPLKKFSSFIPRTMTKEQYDVLISNTINDDRCKIVAEGNRRLYRLDGKGLLVEMYFKDNGAIVRSAIPQFHYEVYRGKEKDFTIEYYDQFSLNDPRRVCTYTVNYEQLFELLLKDPAAVVYKINDDKIIVDVGVLYDRNPKYGSCSIAQGLLVEIDRNLLV